VQKAPELLSLVHSIIEEKKGYQFILTGSSLRKLKRTGSNLLAGRALLCKMFPFIASELGVDFNIETALHTGRIPLILESANPQTTLVTYISLYLKEEVQEEGLVRNLEDLLLGFSIEVFSKRAKRALSAHPKFYLFDAGVFRSLRPKGPLDNNAEINGPALEGLIAQHLYAWTQSQIEVHTLSFFRTKSGLEVDFIIYGPKGFWAIEVKFSSKIHPQDTHSLQSFKEDYPDCTPLLIYMGDKKLISKNILCIPAEEFLKNLCIDKPLPY